MKRLIKSLVHSLIFQILSLASLLQRGFKLLQCNVNEERNSTEVSSTTEYEQHDWRNSSTSLNVPTMGRNALWDSMEVKFWVRQPIWCIPCIPTGSVSRGVSGWRHLENGHQWNTPGLCPAGWVPCLLSEQHCAWKPKHSYVPWLCRDISEILLAAGQSWSQRCSFTVQSLFSVFGKTVVSFLLMHRDAFTHLYTIKCWRWCCFPRRIPGFLPSWVEVSHAGLLLFNKSMLADLDVFVFASNITGKIAVKNKKRAHAAAVCTHQMLWLLLWAERKPVSLRRNMAFFPMCDYALTIGL